MSSIDSDWDKLLSETHSTPSDLRDKQMALLVIHLRRTNSAVDEIRALASSLPAHVDQAVERGLRRVVEDDDVGRRFWEHGYDRISTHATNGISQWVGKRVLMILIAAALSASIGWAVLTGRLK